mgnify:CR=1 FL=1
MQEIQWNEKVFLLYVYQLLKEEEKKNINWEREEQKKAHQNLLCTYFRK